jgi:hypothetical protein
MSRLLCVNFQIQRHLLSEMGLLTPTGNLATTITSLMNHRTIYGPLVSLLYVAIPRC